VKDEDMNWEAIGALGELVGAGGVIASLIFLAFQVRQNSILLRANSAQLEQNHQLAIADALGTGNTQQTAMIAIAEDKELGDLFFRGLRDYRGLSQPDRMRFAMAMGTLIGGVSVQAERQRQLGMHGDSIGTEHVKFVVEFLAMPGGREWWRRYSDRYPERFRRAIDSELERKAVEDPTHRSDTSSAASQPK
jgi:hypothetical protein